MKSRIVALLLCLVLCVGMFAVAQAEAPKLSGTLNYTAMWNEGEPAATFLKGVAAEFEQNTGVKVNLVFAGRDILTTIKSDLLMGNPPDLIDQDFSELTAALLQGDALVKPLNELVDGAGPDGQATFKEIFPAGALELFSREGNIYFVPYLGITSGFFYNKTLYKSLGIEAPTTWEQFMANAKVLKEAGIPPLGLDGNINFYNAYYYYWTCQRVLGDGAFTAAANDKTGALWDDPGYLKAAELVYQLSKSGEDCFQSGYEGSAYPAGQADWALGKSGNVLNGTWLPVETRASVAPDWEYGFYAFPEVEGGKGKITDVENYLIGFAIPKDAQNAPAAEAFILYVLNEANSKKYVEMTDNMSARKDIAPPAVLNDAAALIASATSAHKSYDGLMSELPEWWADVFYPLDNELVFGTKTPEDFIREIKAKTIEYWSRK